MNARNIATAPDFAIRNSHNRHGVDITSSSGQNSSMTRKILRLALSQTLQIIRTNFRLPDSSSSSANDSDTHEAPPKPSCSSRLNYDGSEEEEEQGLESNDSDGSRRGHGTRDGDAEITHASSGAVQDHTSGLWRADDSDGCIYKKSVSGIMDIDSK